MKITQEQMITATTTSSSNFSEADHNPMKFTLKFRNRQQYRDSEINPSSIILNKNNDKDNNNIRVCSDCNTTTTPLWRSGPRGPKSLCNACGIRQRKARRAMAVVGTNGTVTSTEATSSSTKINNSKVINNFKEKKCRTSHKKICFKKLALHYLGKNAGIERVFPKDVEEAAILLMELSCGFFHT